MRRLPKPTDQNGQPYTTGDVFETCVSMVKNAKLRARLRAVRATIETESSDYVTKAEVNQLYTKSPHDQVLTVSKDELVKVYTLRMVPKNSTGRPIYNQILSLPLHGKCPFCGIGTVNTLDHFLPKKSFPAFSVTPHNLVPACTWCQGEKLEYYSDTIDDQLIHPYFDNFEDETWLFAEVVQGNPAGFRFFSNPPAAWEPSLKSKVATHMRELNLALLFSSNAGSRLSEMRFRLVRLHQIGGLEAVRAHLVEELESAESEHKNSWNSAMFRAMTASDWFCDGGFSGI